MLAGGWCEEEAALNGGKRATTRTIAPIILVVLVMSERGVGFSRG
jgi:hypothetical protein